jgi:glycosyltransferase involved in cell wall biosynthesis
MKNGNLLVSIITPTFNRAKFIEKTILSIKNQDYSLIEHIVVDGLSNDNTVDILKKYEKTYNLKWVSEKDSGCQNAINKGFKMATGDIFCWLDSDDFYLPKTLKKVIDVFQNNPDIDAVFGDVQIIDQNGKVINYIKNTNFDIDRLIYLGMHIYPQATFWRASLHKKLGGLDERFFRCADYDFFIRMGLSGAKIHHIRDYLACYRHHTGQLTGSNNDIKKEWDTISGEYINKNFSLVGLKFKKFKILLKQTINYIKQGDLLYVLKGAINRFRNKFFKNKA